MSSARRTLLTATAAGTLLGALWFVPSADASVGTPARGADPAAPTAQVTEQGRPASAVETSGAQENASTGSGTELADTGSIDTTPYVVGGTALLILGAGFVVYSVRRERLGF
ncbi:LAETG motif-containing sortase-dependent surface protein [Streptomyces sp. NPDC002405]|uniref:LAETG motif-containing sortase-dependent surface protein n=1 Tax=Streptomyces sp. NPDC001231 TaxID=3364549 RepID=UPI0036A21B08